MTWRERWEVLEDWVLLLWLATVFCVQWVFDRVFRRWLG